MEFCDGNVALVAHNGETFDLPFLRAEMKRANLEIPTHWLFIDSLKWARRYRKDLPRHSLQYLRQVYGIAENQAHRALNDVMILFDVYSQMVDNLTCEQVVELLSRSAKYDAKKEVPSVKPAPIQQQQETFVLFNG
jgi:DNA polymerase-3 subunit epsilon